MTFMSRTTWSSLAVMTALLAFFVASASAGESLILDPSMDMRWGYIDIANKDRIDYLKYYANGDGKASNREVRLTLLELNKYVKIVPKGTTRYRIVAGKKTWVINRVPARSNAARPTVVIALKVRTDIPRGKLHCIKLTSEGLGPATDTVAARTPPLMGGKNGACWTGKQWLNPITTS